MLILRAVVGIYFIIHGFCHLVGFLVPFKIVKIKEAPYKTTILFDSVDIGKIGIRVFGILWLATAMAFFVNAVGTFAHFQWWSILALYLSIFSTALCILGSPEAKIGILANVIIVGFLLVGKKCGWLP